MSATAATTIDAAGLLKLCETLDQKTLLSFKQEDVASLVNKPLKDVYFFIFDFHLSVNRCHCLIDLPCLSSSYHKFVFSAGW